MAASRQYNDLREFIGELERRSELRRIGTRVSSELEITEITDRVVKSAGPALLFTNVDDGQTPVAINLFGNDARMRLALGIDDYTQITDRIGELIQPEVPAGIMNKLRKVPQLIQLAGLGTKTSKSGVCQQIVRTGDAAKLSDLPIMKCWPNDGGRYITMGVCLCRCPKTGRRNAGVYRLQVFDDRHTGVHIHPFHDGALILDEYRRRGEKMPFAVAVGVDPSITYAATSPLPGAMDELLFAGFLRGAGIDMARCTSIDLDVPATAEIVLEGFVDPTATRIEGPFGDHTGFYSPADQFPIFEITAITMRRDAIYQSMVVGLPPMEDTYLGAATERIFAPMLRTIMPEVVDYHLPQFGVFHNWVVLAIDKRYAGQARKVASAVWGLGQMMLSKFVVIVDADVNVRNLDDVMFHVAANVDPRRDTFFVDGPIDILDHASPQIGFGSKMGIDATRKLPAEGHARDWPDKTIMADDVRKRIDTLWPTLGL